MLEGALPLPFIVETRHNKDSTNMAHKQLAVGLDVTVTITPPPLSRHIKGNYDEGITYFDPGPALRNKLTGWVDNDFAADPDTRKSMTGYIFSLNGDAVSW